MSSFIVRKEIKLHAAQKDVWDALTNPEKTRKYFFGCRVLSDWRPGSPIVFKGRMFLIFPIELKGRILRIEPETLLQYSLDARDGSQSTVTDELTYSDGYTKLSITDDVGQGDGAQKRYKRSLKGWDKVLNGLRRLVEGAG